MDKKTAKTINKFSSKLKKKFAPTKLILFGSRSRGDNFKQSDFDFILVSKKFNGIPFIIRASKIYDYWDEEVDLEIICYTPEEFKRKKNQKGLVKKAVEEGIEII
ncbi:nucleotidyltransferase [Candidatus Woesearchaeota archaeon]|nr:nucleotidyltransferase [Candidatus Woesearchaeota archaeon]